MGPMNYQAFTNDSLTMMYEGVRGALASNDALSGLGEEPRFRIRETPDWKKHAAALFEICSYSCQQIFRKWNERPSQSIVVGGA
jgi:hypothetical protein